MNKIARFIIRPNGNKSDLILGSMFDTAAAQGLLVPDVVYEIREIMGEFIITPLGQAELKIENNRTGVNWNHSISDILECGGKNIFLTEDETDQIC